MTSPVAVGAVGAVAGTVAPEWGTTWAGALDALELDVAAVEDLLDRLHTDSARAAEAAQAVAARAARWAPPSGLGQLPVSLADRARALLARQVEASTALGLAMTATRKQVAVAGLVRQRTEAAPVYVDAAL